MFMLVYESICIRVNIIVFRSCAQHNLIIPNREMGCVVCFIRKREREKKSNHAVCLFYSDQNDTLCSNLIF